ncbi:MAG TPA: hypothetical protein VMO88_06760 [Acidimicrobiales bacterium]|nr:hypothetical protein [Acidimicrobiales bacterium]
MTLVLSKGLNTYERWCQEGLKGLEDQRAILVVLRSRDGIAGGPSGPS